MKSAVHMLEVFQSNINLRFQKTEVEERKKKKKEELENLRW